VDRADRRCAVAGDLLHDQVEGAVVDADAEAGAAARPVVILGRDAARLHVELVGGDAELLAVQRDLVGLRVGLHHEGEEAVDRRVALDEFLGGREGPGERHHVGGLHELFERPRAEPRARRLDAPGGDAGAGGGPALRCQVVLERHVAAGVRLGVDDPRQDVVALHVDNPTGGRQQLVGGHRHDHPAADRHTRLEHPAAGHDAPADELEVDLLVRHHGPCLLSRTADWR
jgi:hypothetical protein